MFRKSIITILVILTACGFKTTDKSKNLASDKWSVRMANTVLSRSDSLIHYVDNNPKWAYDVAFLGMAIDRLGSYDSKYSAYLENWINFFVKPNGTIKDYTLREYNLDRIYPGRDVITVYKRHPGIMYKAAVDTLIQQLKTHPKTKSGGYWHKNIYPWQMWLDGIFMASPFMAQYAKEFNVPGWYDTACNQVITIYEKTLDPATGLLMHAWDESRSQKWCDPLTGRSHYPWSRSMGWYIMAIEDILEYLPENHPQRKQLIEILQKTCKALVRVRDPKTGLWFQVLNCGDRKGNYNEGSGSAMFAYAFARGAHKKYLDSSYLIIANTTFDGILKELITTDSKGLLTMHNICGGCGLGGNPFRDGSYEYYVNEKRVDNDTKGVAPFILAALELDR